MGFKLKDTAEVPKLALKASRYQHSETGLQHIHVRRPDENRVFSLAFKTQAPDKTGVPHILEHTTLCGSTKFPVRDPFFKMQTRSLANYMNALTGTDYTYYPFATTNEQDYRNLQSVYMDSVFSPLLRKQDFTQEGWRLENRVVGDASSPLEFKGVVYNEMKGQMGMPAYYFWISYFQAIYPSLQYSGGDPMHIPELSYEQLVEFHHSKYHPDNCYTFSYGDFDASEALDPLDKYLGEVRPGSQTKPAISSEVPQPISLEEPVRVVKQGPIDPMYNPEKQHKVSLSWYVGESSNVTHTLAWRVLGLLLTDGHASPFYQAIIDTGLAPEFTVNTGMEDTPSKLIFTIGAQGLGKEDIPKFKKQVYETFGRVIASGFPQARVDAIINQAELSDREMDANFGMSLLGRVVSRVFHPNDDAMDTLDNEALLTKFKGLLNSNPEWFGDQLRALLETNPFEFVMEPSSTFEQDVLEKEAGLLEERVAQLSEGDKASILAEGIELEKAQSAAQDIELLPKVTASDIPRTVKDYPTSVHDFNGSKFTVRETPLQGLSYISVSRDFSGIDKSLIPYLQIYSDALTNLGTHDHTMGELEDLIKLNSGGVSTGPGSHRLINEPLGLVMGYGTYGLDTSLEKIYGLLGEVAGRPKFENVSKLKSLLDGTVNNIMDSLSQSGHSYAMGKAAAAVSKRKALDAMVGGFSYVQQLKRLGQMDEGELGRELVPILEKIHSEPWLTKGSISCSPGALGLHRAPLEGFLEGVGATPTPGEGISGVELGAKRTYVPLPFRVSYVGVSIKGPEYEDRDSAALAILGNLLTNKYLHTEIREKDGAYGGGASYNALEGLMNFYSYRDPSPRNSLRTIERCGSWAAAHQWSESDVDEGKVGVFQGIDSPISPRSEISYAVRTGLSLEQRQRRRAHLLGVTPHDLNRVAQKYLVGAEAGICVVGPSGEGLEGFERVEI